MPRNPNCRDCELFASSTNVCVWGHGTGKGFIVGEAPGQAEAKTGKPFQGDSGQLLRRILNEFDLADAYITNTAKCRPPKNRKPESPEIKACSQYLNEEIRDRKPKAILLLGAVAMKARIGRTSITEMNGQVVEKDGQTYVCAFHPAYILRDPSKESALRMAISRYAAVLNGENDQKLPEWELVCKDTFNRFIDDWVRSTKISADVETTGLDWFNPGFDINSISFTLSFPNREKVTWGLPLAKSPILPFAQRKKLMQVLVKLSRKKRVVGHNLKFDNLCLKKVYGVSFRTTSDTCLAHHLVDENTSHELKVISREYCNAPDYDLTVKEKKGGTTTRKLLTYNGADAFYTSEIDDWLIKKMDEDERWLYKKVVIPASRVLTRGESNGLYVDLKKMDEVERVERQKMIDMENQLNRIAGRTVNWNAPAQVAKVLYDDLKIEPLVFTDKGAPSTGEAALVDIDHEVVDLLIKYREHSKFLSTYIGELQPDGTYRKGLRDFMVGPHLYISTKMNGTVTGRYSSRLHSIPRDGTVRNIFTAPPGWTFWQLDLSQAELRIIAIVAGEPEMLRCFKVGIDIHWQTLMDTIETGQGEYVNELINTAKTVTGSKKISFELALRVVRDITPEAAVEIWKGWKEARKKAKGINFGFPYGQSAEGFISYAKLKYGFEPTLPESQNFRNAFFNRYAFLPAWHERQKALAASDGFVRNLAGRKRRLPGIWSTDRSVRAECERQAINAPIQGFIGDYKAMIMVELGTAFDWSQFRVLFEHHDAILGWVRTEAIDDIMPEVIERAQNPKLARECGLDFPIKMDVDVELGPWGAGKKYHVD